MTSTLDRIHHSRYALAHVVDARTWRRAFSVGASDAGIAPAIRVGLAVAVVLIGGGLMGRPDIAGFAALGALCSAFGRYEPYPRRAGKLALVSAFIVLYATAGAALAILTNSTALHVVAVSLASGLAALLLSAFAILGPGPVILVFAATAAVAFAQSPGDITTVFVATTTGSVVGLVASMLPALFHPVGPAQLAVARALAAVDAGNEEPARAAIARARIVVTLNTGRRRRHHGLGLVTLLDDAEVLLDAQSAGRDIAHADRVLAHERRLRGMRRYDALPVRAAHLADRPRHFVADGMVALRSKPLLLNAFRIVVAAALAAWCASALGFEHPLWATMGAMAAMQGITFHTTVQRGIQRLIGNVGGAAVAAVLISLSLGYWQTAAAIVVFQVAAELLVTRNYGLTSLAITPMALLMTGLAGQLDPSVAVDRIGDTLVGVLIGIIVAALTIEIGDRAHLA